MRSLIALATIAATVIGSSLAFAETSYEAAETGHVVAGVVKSYDAKDGKILLENGQSFHLPKDYSGPTVSVGEKLSIDWSAQAGEKIANRVTILE